MSSGEGSVAEAALAVTPPAVANIGEERTLKGKLFGNISKKIDPAMYNDIVNKLKITGDAAKKIQFTISGFKDLPNKEIYFDGESIETDGKTIGIKGSNVTFVNRDRSGINTNIITSTTPVAGGGNRRSKRHHASHKSKKHSHKKTLKRIKKFFQKK